MTELLTRRVVPEEWRALRDVRLAALEDAPDAFATTHAEAVSYADRVWIDRAMTAARGETQATYVVADGSGRLLGLVTGIPVVGGPEVCQLVSMWIDPEIRARGWGSALVRDLIVWASTSGYDVMRLWVTATNAAARGLYESLGFAPTGVTQPLPSNPGLEEILYELELMDRGKSAPG